jgi:hypothetical protein
MVDLSFLICLGNKTSAVRQRLRYSHYRQSAEPAQLRDADGQ